jgi:predicted membrane-bound mannosyltransferase
MGSLGTTHFVALLLAVAVAAAAGGFLASKVVRRKKRRARGIFLVGFFCGVAAALVARRNWHDTGRLAVRAFSSSALPVRLGFAQPRRPRLMWVLHGR